MTSEYGGLKTERSDDHEKMRKQTFSIKSSGLSLAHPFHMEDDDRFEDRSFPDVRSRNVESKW